MSDKAPICQRKGHCFCRLNVHDGILLFQHRQWLTQLSYAGHKSLRVQDMFRYINIGVSEMFSCWHAAIPQMCTE